MASSSFTHFLSLPRWDSTWTRCPSSLNFLRLQDFRLQNKWGLAAISRKKIAENFEEEKPSENGVVVKKKTTRTSKRASTRSKKKAVDDTPGEISETTVKNDVINEENLPASRKDSNKTTTRRTRRKAGSTSASLEEEGSEKVRRRRRTKKTEEDVGDGYSESEPSDLEQSAYVSNMEKEGLEKVRRRRRTKKTEEDVADEYSETETSDLEQSVYVSNVAEEGSEKVRRRRRTKKIEEEAGDECSESETSDLEQSAYVSYVEQESDVDIEFDKDDDDISDTYGWPPLVCCFGAAQHAFVPSGRPANRLIDHELHERMKGAFWDPEKLIRAPGGSAGSVAIALASLGGKVAFMGKLGDDDYGQAMLYYLNMHNVQTRSVRIDSKRATAQSKMKIIKRGGLRLTCVKPCAEDSLSKSDINIDVLKEAKMFYFSTHSLLDQSMRSATLRAINIAKKLGAVIFYDINLPLSLWQSSEETKLFIQQVWNLANIIEVTKQELEFLCGIKPTEEFDTKNNASSKFTHHGPEVVKPLWHDSLEVLFVTNGTSKIHYYTKEHNGAVLGVEDAPLTPFSGDMSASGDGIVAGLMRMLTVQPHLITDQEYLKHSIRYAIDCGMIDQWIEGRTRGFPTREDMEEVEPDPYGIRSITHREYRTVESAEEPEPDQNGIRSITQREYQTVGSAN